MMHTGVISAKDYYFHQHKLCCKYLRAYAKIQSADYLHKLRVCIKKISAVLKMLAKLEPGFDYTGNFAPYKDISKPAGVIREQFLHAEKLKKSGTQKPAPSSLRLIARLNRELVKATPEYLAGVSKIQSGICDYFDKTEDRKIAPHCKKMFKQIAGKWRQIHSEEELHSYRKKLKEFLYCSHLLSDKEKAKIASAKKYKMLDELQDIIGKWHDNVLLLNKIKKDGLPVDNEFLPALKHETYQLLSKARKKGNRI